MEYAQFDDLIKKALEYIRVYHGDQKYGDKPYLVHLTMVQDILVEFGYFPNKDVVLGYQLMVAALLHDILEDTKLTYKELEQDFGSAIAQLVWRVTKENGSSRNESYKKTYMKIKGDTSAVALKLADRLANVRYSVKTGNPILEMYKKEWEVFRRELESIDQHTEMWNELEKLLLD